MCSPHNQSGILFHGYVDTFGPMEEHQDLRLAIPQLLFDQDPEMLTKQLADESSNEALAFDHL